MFNIFQVSVFFGGLPIQKDEKVLKNTHPHIVVGTPGRILALVKSKKLDLKYLKHFVLDECDRMLEELGIFCNFLPINVTMTLVCYKILIMLFIFIDMRSDVQEIFKCTPHGKQVMMFSATLSKEIRPVCKKFMQDVRCGDFDFTSNYNSTLNSNFIFKNIRGVG